MAVFTAKLTEESSIDVQNFKIYNYKGPYLLKQQSCVSSVCQSSTPVLPVPNFSEQLFYPHTNYKPHQMSARNANFGFNIHSVTYNMSFGKFNEMAFMRGKDQFLPLFLSYLFFL